VKRGLTVVVAGAAILAAGLSGCSSNKSTTSGSGTSTSAGSSTTASSGGGGGAAGPKVIIDGQDQRVTGSVVCTTAGVYVNITIGGAATGIEAVLTTDANPPQVKSVGLGNVNGATLVYTSGTGRGNASATKDGNSYKITGTATAADMANPAPLVNKPFEIDVTCSYSPLPADHDGW
jgi:lipoprotein LpqH